jgi:hypothetical protein
MWQQRQTPSGAEWTRYASDAGWDEYPRDDRPGRVGSLGNDGRAEVWPECGGSGDRGAERLGDPLLVFGGELGEERQRDRA